MASHPRLPPGDQSRGGEIESSFEEPTSGRLEEQKATQRDILLALSYGLELARHGAMLVAEDGQPRLANQTALAILKKKDGLLLASGGLVADRASDTRLLHRLLEKAIHFPDLGESKESPFLMERKWTPNPLIVRVIPGPGLESWNSPQNRSALLKVYDQDLGLVVDDRALISLYGLTRGEAALATKLVQGKSIEDSAAELFISAHTARTHLKRIFMKTDTHRQPELLVRMMLTGT